jgi:hypothetical protein
MAALIIPAFAYGQSSQPAGIAAAVAEMNKGDLFEGIRLLKEVVRRSFSPAAYFTYPPSTRASTDTTSPTGISTPR